MGVRVRGAILSPAVFAKEAMSGLNKVDIAFCFLNKQGRLTLKKFQGKEEKKLCGFYG
jgi:hypothetical protein